MIRRLAALSVAPAIRPTVCVLATILGVGCAPERGVREPASSSPKAPLERGPFVDRAREVGLGVEHENGMSGERYFSEHMGGGAALFDMDGDGDLDLFLPQGVAISEHADGRDAVDRLFRNEMSPSGELRFVEVTRDSGIRGDEYAMGVAVGDYDGDGRPDLFVTQWNAPNRLYRNLGGGRFEDRTEEAGVGDSEWAISATFVDYDLDGRLDLYVANYTAFSLDLHKSCRTFTGALDYCGPQAFRPLVDRLYRNVGDGVFRDVSREAGIDGAPGSGLGVVAFDGDDDRWPDLYVANDQMPNRMWLNGSGRGFADGALANGTALNADGHAEAGMGIAVGDYDRDGLEDLLVTHLDRETHTLYRQLRAADAPVFYDATAESGLGAASYAATGFGVAWLDYDLDGWLDLYVANGAVKLLEPLVRAGDAYPMGQPNQLFRNRGAGRFVEVAVRANGEEEPVRVSRGVARGDVDNDGDDDLVVVNNAGPVELLINEKADGSWIGFEVSNRRGGAALGAVVRLTSEAGEPLFVASVRRDGSYASANDPRIRFGLGAATDRRSVVVRWTDGSTERWDDLEIGRYHELVRGDGVAE